MITAYTHSATLLYLFVVERLEVGRIYEALPSSMSLTSRSSQDTETT